MIIENREEMRHSVMRLAVEAVESNGGTESLVLIGIRRRGAIFARRLQHEIERLEGKKVPLGTLDIAPCRDGAITDADALCKDRNIGFAIDGKTVILCDDVLYTGRTVRAALAAVVAIGKPKNIRFYALIDRGHRDLPFRADGVGKTVPTSASEKISVHFKETDGEDCVLLTK